jgi:hypothetical protein
MPASSSPQPTECEVLHELREHPAIIRRVQELSGPELHIQNLLRKEYPDAVVRAALSLVELRRKGTNKFTRASEMWFDRQGLEQSTAEPVARHKARRFQQEVWDLCCGIGGDVLALAEHTQVVAVDLNPAACLRTKWNAEVYGVADRVTTHCHTAEEVVFGNSLVHIDPDRRRHGPARSVRIEEYVPGLEFLQQLVKKCRGGAIKLSPASNFGGKFQDVEHELISLHGECKEATIWFGELAGEHAWRATALPSGESLFGDPLSFGAEVTPPGAYLFDPDPAVVRAGLVDCLAERLSLSRLDTEEEYLTGSVPVSSPFLQTFELVAELSNNDKEIRNYFRNSTAGQVEIKCRRIPVDAEAVRRKLPLPGTDPAVLIFARVEGKARALVCRRLQPDSMG